MGRLFALREAQIFGGTIVDLLDADKRKQRLDKERSLSANYVIFS